MVRYLLGDLPEDEREQFEQRYFVDENLWLELCATEEDLIDSYVRGGLLPAQKAQFESYFLASPRRRRQVEVARMLTSPELRERFPEGRSETPPSPARVWRGWFSAPRLTFALATLIVAAGLFLLLRQNRLLQSEIAREHATGLRQKQQIDELSRKIASLTNAPVDDNDLPVEASALPTISLLLRPGLQRSAGDRGGVLPAAAVPSQVLLVLDLRRDDAAAYDVVLTTAEGREVHRAVGLHGRPSRNGGRVVVIKLPSSLLPRGDYMAVLLSVDGRGRRQSVDSYVFSVVR